MSNSLGNCRRAENTKVNCLSQGNELTPVRRKRGSVLI